VRLDIRALIAAAVGAALTWGMFWLEESVLPEVAIYVPLAAGRLLIMGVILATTWLALRRWPMLAAAAVLAGSGLGWALHEIDPLLLCQSDMLYRPCTSSEIGWMVVPPIVLVLLAGGTLAAVVRQVGRAHPA
jgi:hypothetical protein